MELADFEDDQQKFKRLRETLLVVLAAATVGGGSGAWLLGLYDELRVELFLGDKRITQLEDRCRYQRERLEYWAHIVERLQSSSAKYDRELSRHGIILEHLQRLPSDRPGAASGADRAQLESSVDSLAERLDRLEHDAKP